VLRALDSFKQLADANYPQKTQNCSSRRPRLKIRAVRRPRPAAADNLRAPPPTFVHRRAAADGIFALYLFSSNFGSMTKKGHQKIFRKERHFFGNFSKICSPPRCRHRPKLTARSR